VSGPASSRHRKHGKQELSTYQVPGIFSVKRDSFDAIFIMGLSIRINFLQVLAGPILLFARPGLI
jgi:hypothetical protein